MKIIWNGHACFTLECENGTIAFDPYKDNTVPGLKPLQLKADKVLCSHGHDDHNAVEVVQISKNNKHFDITKIPSYHDNVDGTLRGNNSIHVVKSEGMMVVHLGDLGHALSKEQQALIQNCDVLMIPVGGYYTIDGDLAYQITQTINPRIIIPMHYRNQNFGYKVISELDVFIKHFDTIKTYDTNLIEVTPTTPHQVAVLTYL